MTPTTTHGFPRLPLIGAGFVVAMALGAAILGRMGAADDTSGSPVALVSSTLTFSDRDDGGIDVYRDGGATPVEQIRPGTNGFLRATMRGLASERKRRAIGPSTPFRLTAWADGRLTLDDPATGRHVELEAFGQTNEAVFAALLPDMRVNS